MVALIGAGVIGAVIANSINSPSVASPASATSCNVTSVAEEQLPSVVTIVAGNGERGGTGSGEVIRPEGYILTNNHVIIPATSGGSLKVLFDDGNTASATIVGRDPLTDLAVVRVSGQSGLRAIPIGNSKDLRIGQPVIALGAPLGLSSTVTAGIVSALDRTIHVPGEGQQSALLIDAVQTDASINPGNSGGALVDCSGDLAGAPTAGATVPSPRASRAAGASDSASRSRSTWRLKSPTRSFPPHQTRGRSGRARLQAKRHRGDRHAHAHVTALSRPSAAALVPAGRVPHWADGAAPCT